MTDRPIEEGDWLEGDAAVQRHEQELKDIDEAQIYLLFTDNIRGKELLERWDRDVLHLRTPPDSNVQQYASDEALRAFIARLHFKIDLAQRKQG